ncbi:MAG: hypothetical protein LBU73_04180 [Helicobacteraceae bacterium]|jgi:hypothetical protein|nr:hypothetical protein [Helicobacteraceae bacterium]
MLRKFIVLGLFLSTLAAETLILRNEIVIDKAADKIAEMTSELEAKTGVKVYLSAIQKLDAAETLGAFHSKIEENLTAPYVLVSFSAGDQKIKCTRSADLAKIIDCDDAVDDYILPIITEYRKDISKQTQYSAGLLNGIAHICDTIAAAKGVQLLSSIGSESKNFYNGLVTIVLIMAALTIFALFWARNRDKGGK